MKKLVSRTYPAWMLLNPSKKYLRSWHTDLRTTFAEYRSTQERTIDAETSNASRPVSLVSAPQNLSNRVR